MSDDGPNWFAPKRYGYGAGAPISWQGWALTLGYVAVVSAVALWLHKNVLQFAAILLPLTLVFIVISARTTKGGWRWRWGDND